MNVYDAIKQRRSIRQYKPDPIPEDVLHRLLEALRLSPSGGNYQPRKFVVVRDREMIKKLATAGRANPVSISGAPLVIVAYGSEKEAIGRYVQDGQVVLGKGDAIPEAIKKGTYDYESALLMDLIIALDHLTLAARAEGLGTVWIGAINERKVKEILSIPQDCVVPIVMPVGYPVSWPEAKPRKPLAELVTYDHA